MAESLLPNTIEYEVIMVGPNSGEVPPKFKHILTNVKPAQCYEIGFRNANGELITWSADDANYSPQALDNAYKFWKSFNNEKIIIAFRTVEDGIDVTDVHRFFQNNLGTPRMAPFGLMSRELFMHIGGYDRRFIGGQSENDIVMRVLEIGGTVEICQNAAVIVDHMGAHPPEIGSAIKESYIHDRNVLEKLWVNGNNIVKNRISSVEKFSDDNILLETQGFKGQW